MSAQARKSWNDVWNGECEVKSPKVSFDACGPGSSWRSHENDKEWADHQRGRVSSKSTCCNKKRSLQETKCIVLVKKFGTKLWEEKINIRKMLRRSKGRCSKGYGKSVIGCRDELKDDVWKRRVICDHSNSKDERKSAFKDARVAATTTTSAKTIRLISNQR